MLENPAQSLVKHETRDHIAIISVDNPPMNVLDFPTKLALLDVFRDLEEREYDIEVVILTSSGNRSFMIGEDHRSLLVFQPEMVTQRLRASHALFAAIAKCTWPVIAAIHGYCLGEGLELAISCDVRYASETAVIGFSGVNLSTPCVNNKTIHAQNCINAGHPNKILDSGIIISTGEALLCGLIDRAVPDGQVLQAALELARTIVKHAA